MRLAASENNSFKPLSEEDIARLPHRGRVVFAARCALRVFPLLGREGNFDYWGEDARRHLRAVEAALAAALGGGSGDDKIIAAAAAADAAARAAADVAADVARAAYAAAAAADVARAAYAAADVARAAYAAAYADAYADADARADWQRLLNEDPAAVLSSPVWSVAPPRRLATILDKFSKAAKFIGEAAVYRRYMTVHKGKPDFGAYRRVLKTWHSENAPGKKGRTVDVSVVERVSVEDSAEAEVTKDDDALADEATEGTNVLDSGGEAQGKQPQGSVATLNRDAPPAQDHLGREALIFALRDLLDYKGYGGEVTIGLLGHWGDGKTSVLSMLQGELERRERMHRGEAAKRVFGLGDFLPLPWREALRRYWQAGHESKSVFWRPLSRLLFESLFFPAGGVTGTQPEHDFIFAHFNAWAYEHTDNIQAGLAQEVVNGFTRRFDFFQRGWLLGAYVWRAHAWRVLFSLVVLLGVPALLVYSGITFPSSKVMAAAGGATGVLLLGLFLWKQSKAIFSHPLATRLSTYLRLPEFGDHLGALPVIKQQVRDFCEIGLRSMFRPRRLIFMVDDLDRCGVNGIVKTLEAIRLVMELPDVTVIVAIDPRMAMAALTHHYSDLAENGSERTAQAIARDYLGKILQIPIHLGAPAPRGVEQFIDKVLFTDTVDSPASGVRKTDSSMETRLTSSEAPGSISVKTDKVGGLANDDDLEAVAGDSGMSEEIEASTQSEAEEADTDSDDAPGQETAPLRDFTHERDHFLTLARLLKFTNPRRLKRLHNCYRLLKGIQFHTRHETDSALNASYMSMLFWLEYLHGLEPIRRKAEEDYMLDQGGKKGPLGETAHNFFYSEFEIDEHGRKQYDEIRERVTPFMLPYAEAGEIEMEADDEGDRDNRKAIEPE